MKSDGVLKKSESVFWRTAWLLLLAIMAGLPMIQRIEAANVMVWDTGARFTNANGVLNRESWKAVPSELFVFEKNPPKAASDPGYYGREYSFKGDAVVENSSITAVFWSEEGRVVLYSPENDWLELRSGGHVGPGRPLTQQKIVEFVPLQARAKKISRCEIVRNAGDEVVIRALFSSNGSAEQSATFSFGKEGIVEIKPSAGLKGMRLTGSIDYGIAPSFIGDDLIFSPTELAATATTVHAAADNFFLGLLRGENSEFVLTWPKGNQKLSLNLVSDSQSKRAIESVDLENDGRSFCVGVLSAPGIWHREELKPAYLEKDVPLEWKRPFPAKWKTQLTEAGVRTTFAFRQSKGEIWRGVPGSYNYPVWFDGTKAVYHLSKKVPPKGESLAYFVGGEETPESVSTPVDILKATLGREMCEGILDVAGQNLRTHHRRGGDGVHRACTCGCTEAIQAVFESGQEVTKQDYVKEALGDMNYFVEHHVERIEEYRRFANEMIPFLQGAGGKNPELKPFLESLEQIVQQIPQEYDVQKENMKSAEHANELTRRTMALTGSKNTNNLTAYMDLLKAWRAMGGAQDYVVAQCHMITRKLFQEAGYGCVNDPKAVAVAQEVRARCRQVLRNPDGYEIWANY